MTARPTIGVGKGIGGRVKFAHVQPVCSSSTLATATMPPGPASSTGVVSSACISIKAAIFTAFRAPDTVIVRILFQRAGKDADEIQFLHERIDAGLEHLRDQRPGGIGLDFDRFAGGVRRRCV